MDPRYLGRERAYARPVSQVEWSETAETAGDQEGLTKREVFAKDAPPMPDWFATAMGCLDPDCPEKHGVGDCEKCSAGRESAEAHAKWAVAYADALLAELAKGD